MNLARILAVAEKDLRESAATSQVLLPITIVPLVFVLIYPVGLLVALRFPEGALQLGDLLSRVPVGAIREIAGLTPAGQIAYLATVYWFAGFFLIIPVMVASVLAANSFAGEKERHTVEGLLYTPLSDSELVIGKMAGVVAPAVAFSWVCFVVYAVIVNVLGRPLVGRIFFPTMNWAVLMLLVVPAASIFVTAIVVWVSARVRGYQEANSIAGAAVVPVLILVLGQATGVMLAGPALFGVLGLALAVADVFLVRWIVRTFDREKVAASLA